MPFILDGYNLIYRDEHLAEIIDERSPRAARDELLAAARVFAERARREVTVVFDGGKMSDPALPRREMRGGVEALYSEYGQSADDLIEEIIAGHRTPADLYVVSDDKSVGRAIEARGAHKVPVQEFLDKMRQISRRRAGGDGEAGGGGADEKPAGADDFEVDYWLRAMGLEESGGEGSR